jgi:ABC-type Fe3+/spermidine/putrescine transport system ATPase subunit
MNDGGIEQEGSPTRIYREPGTPFVARFIGESNLWEGTITRDGVGGVQFTASDGLRFAVADADGLPDGARVMVSVRPETVVIARAPGAAIAGLANRVPGTVEEIGYTGASTRYRVRIDDTVTVHVVRPNAEGEDPEGTVGIRESERVVVGWRPGAGRIIRST